MFLLEVKNFVDLIALVRAVLLCDAFSLIKHLLGHTCVLIEHRLCDFLVKGEILWLYLTESEYS